MEFAFSPEQTELAAMVRTLLARRADSGAVRAASTADLGHDPELWALLCEQVGVAALAVPEEYDGAGFSLFEALIVLEELGRSLAPSPLLATLVATEALLAAGDEAGAEEARRRLLPRIAAGEIATLAWSGIDGPTAAETVTADGDLLTGTLLRVLDGDRADVVLVAARDGDALALFEVDPALLAARWTPSMDQSVRLATLTFDATPATRIAGDAATALTRAGLVGSVGAAALQAGCSARGLEMTVAYTQQRVQFGRAIGSFQALKHRMADMLVELEMSRSASWAASYAVATRAENAERLAHVAKSYCGDALTLIAAETVQLHGGIAITWEHDAQLVFKRAHALSQLFGQAHQHRALIAL